MKVFVYKITLVLLAQFFFAPPALWAEPVKDNAPPQLRKETNPETDNGEQLTIDPEKKAAIEELFAITQIDKRVEDLKKAVFSRAERIFQVRMLDDLKKEKRNRGLTDDQLKQLVKSESSALSSSFTRQFDEKINLTELVKETAFKLYSKYFTTAELKDISNFYKTPTGAKARKIMPKLARESLVLTQSKLRPVLTDIMKQTLKERRDTAGDNDEEKDRNLTEDENSTTDNDTEASE